LLIAHSKSTIGFERRFFDNDKSFTMVDNKRELAVLASCLLEAAVEDGNVAAGLAPVVASVAGNRKPVYRPELIDELTDQLSSLAVIQRHRGDLDAKSIRLPADSKFSVKADNIIEDSEALIIALAALHDRPKTLTTNLANQTFSVLSPLIKQFHDLREEVDLLWWHIGGWNRVLEKPFSELDVALASALAGFDMAQLTSSPPGGVAAPAILQRTIDFGRSGRTGKTSNRKVVTIKEAVDAFPSDRFQDLKLSEKLDDTPDICVVLSAYRKAATIGTGPAWYGASEKASGISAETKFSPLELAMQVYREAMLLWLLA
jgi:hypothetical protein